MRHFDVIVIGGGAAGVMAAGVAAGTGRKVLLCEKMEKPQRKVRITGKGRCNLTNMRSMAEFLSHVHESPEFVAEALRGFSNEDAYAFFERIGVPLAVERGDRVFPVSGKAWDVAEAHIRWCRKQGVVIECGVRVVEICAEHGHVTGVLTENKQGKSEHLAASRVILATGGVSYPATGSTGDGYLLAHSLGHTIVEVRPSLTPLETHMPGVRALKGLALRNIAASLRVDGKIVRQEFGEMEFTPYVAGPIVLRMSRSAVDALIDGRRVDIVLDLKPALSEKQLENRLVREWNALGRSADRKSLLRKLLPAQLLPVFESRLPIRSGQKFSCDEQERSRIIRLLKEFVLPIDDYRPFEEAIVTAGGVSTDEIDPRTMQSRRVKGLYFAGEVIDIDADTGGYNLQLAYSTGYLAGALKD